MDFQKEIEWNIVFFDIMPNVVKYCDLEAIKNVRLTQKKFIPMCKDLTWKLTDENFENISKNKLVQKVTFNYVNHKPFSCRKSPELLVFENIKQLKITNGFYTDGAIKPLTLEYMAILLFLQIRTAFPKLEQLSITDIPFDNFNGFKLKSKTIKKYLFHATKLAFETRNFYLEIEEEIEEFAFVLENPLEWQIGPAEVDKMQIFMNQQSRNRIKNLKITGDVSVIISNKKWKRALNESTFLFVLFDNKQVW